MNYHKLWYVIDWFDLLFKVIDGDDDKDESKEHWEIDQSMILIGDRFILCIKIESFRR